MRSLWPLRRVDVPRDFDALRRELLTRVSNVSPFYPQRSPVFYTSARRLPRLSSDEEVDEIRLITLYF